MDKGYDKVARVPTSLDGKFFRRWFEFLKPYHNLTDREIDVISSLVKHRYELGKVISDEDILNKVTLGDDTKRKVMEECSITPSHFQGILGKLRKSKIIIDGKINGNFIPQIKEGADTFKLMILFEFQ